MTATVAELKLGLRIRNKWPGLVMGVVCPLLIKTGFQRIAAWLADRLVGLMALEYRVGDGPWVRWSDMPPRLKAKL